MAETTDGIRYLITERELSAQHGFPIHCPVRVFDLSALGIDTERFISELAPYFERLAWDMYDVKREQVYFLSRRCDRATEMRLLSDFLPRYFRDETDLRDILPLLCALSEDDKREFERIRSYRRRAVAKFVLSRQERLPLWNEGEWHIEHEEMSGFVQDVLDDDARRLERIFDPACTRLIAHSKFRKLLIGVAELVEDVDPDVQECEMTFHQMGLQVVPHHLSSNAPEGKHKDGADYIVSALIVARDNVSDASGVSVVYGGADGTVPLLEVTLDVGQGLFQADKHSTLWHDVTPCRVADSTVSDGGVRNIFGFDINVTRRFPPSS